jgi:TonB family protein
VVSLGLTFLARVLVAVAQQPVAPPADSCPTVRPDEAPRILAMVAPAYPESLRVRKIGGTVWLQVEVNCDGLAERGAVRVISSPHPGLDGPAWNAVAYAVFAPGRAGGRAVRARLEVPVLFGAVAETTIVLLPAGSGSGQVFSDAVVDERPEVLSFPPVNYPESLRRIALRGDVILEFIIDTLGRAEPASLSIIESPEPAMSAEAIRAALAATFRPARVKGRAVRVLVRLPIQFRLSR